MPSVLNVAVLIYANADIMDFSGPVETYYAAEPSETNNSFKVTTFAHENPVSGARGVLVYVPNASFEEIERQLENYDILVIPGAHPETIEKFVPSEYGQKTLALLKRFVTLPPRKEAGHRILQSVCSGALILGAAGVLKGRTATTHHTCYDLLKVYADQAAGGDSGTNVVKKRWVDCGKTDEAVRIVTAGGVSSGIDASLWITELVCGTEVYKASAELMEFERRGEGQAWGVAAS